MSKLSTVKRKLTEPSTWLGLGSLGYLFGVKELAAFAAPEFALAITSIMGIFLKEAPDLRAPGQGAGVVESPGQGSV